MLGCAGELGRLDVEREDFNGLRGKGIPLFRHLGDINQRGENHDT